MAAKKDKKWWQMDIEVANINFSGRGFSEAPDSKQLYSSRSCTPSESFTPRSRPSSSAASESAPAPQAGSSAWLRARTLALEAERSNLVRFTLELQALLDQIKGKLRSAPPKRLNVNTGGNHEEETHRWMRDIESLTAEKQELVSRMIVESQQSFFMSQGKNEKGISAVYSDLGTVVTQLNLHFKQRTLSLLSELQDESETIDVQKGALEKVRSSITPKHDSIGNTPRTSFMIAILQDTFLVLSHCQRLISLVAQFAQHCFQHRELKVKWRLAVASQAEKLRRKIGLLPAFFAWIQPCEYSKQLKLSEQRCKELRKGQDLKNNWRLVLEFLRRRFKLREAETSLLLKMSSIEGYVARTGDPLRRRKCSAPSTSLEGSEAAGASEDIESAISQADPVKNRIRQQLSAQTDPVKRVKVGQRLIHFLAHRSKFYSVLAWKARARRNRIMRAGMKRASFALKESCFGFWVELATSGSNAKVKEGSSALRRVFASIERHWDILFQRVFLHSWSVFVTWERRNEKEICALLGKQGCRTTKFCLAEWRETTKHRQRKRAAALSRQTRKLRRALDACAKAQYRLRLVNLYSNQKMMRLLIRSSNAMLEAWKVQMQKSRRERKVVYIMKHKAIFQAFNTWLMRLTDGRILKSKLASIVRRWQMGSVASAYHGWAWSVNELDRARAVVRRVICRIHHTNLARTWDEWSQMVTARSKARETAMSVLRKWQGGLMSTAFASWLYSNEERRRCVGMAKQVVKRCSNRMMWSAFSFWNQVSRDQRRIFGSLKKMLLKWQGGAKAVALSTWKDQTICSARLKRAGRKIIARMQDHLIWTAWSKWEATYREHRRLARAAIMVVRRWQGGATASAFHTWYAQGMKQQRLTLAALKLINRWKSGVLWMSFWGWLTHANEQKRLAQTAEKAVRRWQNGSLTTGFSTWHKMAKEQERQLRGVSKALARWQGGLIASSFTSWHEHASEQLRLVRTALKVVQRMRNSVLSVAWGTWVLITGDQKRLARVSAKILLQWTRLHICRAWLHWTKVVQEQRRLQAAATKVVVRMKSKGLWRAFASFLGSLNKSQELMVTMESVAIHWHAIEREVSNRDRLLARSTFVAWHGAQHRVSLKVADNCMRRIANLGLSRSLIRWAEQTQQIMQARETCQLAAARLLNGNLWSAFNRLWCNVGDKRKARAEVAKAVHRMRSALMSVAFWTWYGNADADARLPEAVAIKLDQEFGPTISDPARIQALSEDLQKDISVALCIPATRVSVLCHQRGSIIAEVAIMNSVGRKVERDARDLAEELVRMVKDNKSEFRKLPLGGLAMDAALHGPVSATVCEAVMAAQHFLLEQLQNQRYRDLLDSASTIASQWERELKFQRKQQRNENKEATNFEVDEKDSVSLANSNQGSIWNEDHTSLFHPSPLKSSFFNESQQLPKSAHALTRHYFELWRENKMLNSGEISSTSIAHAMISKNSARRTYTIPSVQQSDNPLQASFSRSNP